MPKFPTRPAPAVTLRLPPSVVLEDQADRLPDSKPFAKIRSVTVTITSSLLLRLPSLTVRARTYAPALAKLAVVTAAFGSPNVTVSGPLTLVQIMVNVLDGRPSSRNEPFSVAVLGQVIVWSGPASTSGAWLGARGVALTWVEFALSPLLFAAETT